MKLKALCMAIFIIFVFRLPVLAEDENYLISEDKVLKIFAVFDSMDRIFNSDDNELGSRHITACGDNISLGRDGFKYYIQGIDLKICYKGLMAPLPPSPDSPPPPLPPSSDSPPPPLPPVEEEIKLTVTLQGADFSCFYYLSKLDDKYCCNSKETIFILDMFEKAVIYLNLRQEASSLAERYLIELENDFNNLCQRMIELCLKTKGDIIKNLVDDLFPTSGIGFRTNGYIVSSRPNGILLIEPDNNTNVEAKWQVNTRQSWKITDEQRMFFCLVYWLLTDEEGKVPRAVKNQLDHLQKQITD